MNLTRARLAYLRASLSYDPELGLFRWQQSRRSHGGMAKEGAIAGTAKDGYTVVTVDGTQYRASVLAWWFMTGLPVPREKELDHRNRRKSDDRWLNLRLIDRSGNNHNSTPARTNKSGVRGVSWSKTRNKWDARITINRRAVLLGRHVEFRDAVAARLAAERHYFGEASSESLKTPRYKPEVTVHAATEEQKQEALRKKSLTVRTTNTTGYPGVRLHKQSGLWHARIVVNYRETSLGYYKTFDEAVAARKAAEEKRFG